MRQVLAAVFPLALVAAACAHGARRLAPCTGAQLGGSFAVIPGSAGAGSISYRLRLRNRSDRLCVLTGLPSVRLLGRTGAALPTRVRAARPGALTAVLVRLAPGGLARATARFSPDVPGPGEPVNGLECERIAYTLRVNAPGGGTTKVKITPPTAVCEHGLLFFSAYGY